MQLNNHKFIRELFVIIIEIVWNHKFIFVAFPRLPPRNNYANSLMTTPALKESELLRIMHSLYICPHPGFQRYWGCSASSQIKINCLISRQKTESGNCWPAQKVQRSPARWSMQILWKVGPLVTIDFYNRKKECSKFLKERRRRRRSRSEDS